MNRRSGIAFAAAAVVIAIAATANVRAWRQSVELRTAIGIVRLDVGELSRLKVENQRLRQKQIPAAELAALRADHDALPRLRSELEALTKTAVSNP
jgi:hypothetical protein